MLTEILHLIEKSPRASRLEDLARALHAQPSAVEGMIATLIRSGRIIEIGPDDRPCGVCALQEMCDLPVQYGRRFVSRPRGSSIPLPTPNGCGSRTPTLTAR